MYNKPKNHQSKSIISKKQGFWISVGIILLLLFVTGNLQKIYENINKITTNFIDNLKPITESNTSWNTSWIHQVDFFSVSMIILVMLVFIVILKTFVTFRDD